MPELVFATFNTHWGLMPGRKSCEPYDLAAACRQLEADVLVLQEAWRPDHGDCVLDELAADPGYELAELPLARGHRVAHSRPHIGRPGEGVENLAVLSRFPIRAQRILRIGRVPLDPVGPRGALHVELDVDGTPLDVVTVHTSSKVPYGPVLHLRRLRPQLPGASGAAVVAGDMNIWGPWVAGLLPEWKRAVRGRTWPAHRPHSQIDHILVNDRVAVADGRVADEQGSDHRPLLATVRIR